MNDELKVYVRGPAERTFWMLQWRDPETGLTKSRSSGVRRVGANGNKPQAERAAAILQNELESGLQPNAGRVTWETFRGRYESEHVPKLKMESGAKIKVVFGLVDRILRVRHLRDIGERQLSRLEAALRQEGKSDSTIHSYLATLKAMLSWAQSQKLINARPAFPKIPRRKKSGCGDLMKGRAPTSEEFDHICRVVPDEVGAHGHEAWARYLRGLWLSGLRLSESLEFWWDRKDRMHPVFANGRHPYLRIVAEFEKGNRDRELPMTPDFAAFLLETPPSERCGRVFRLPGMRPGSLEIRSNWVGKVISRIGKRAGVVVAGDPRDPARVKYASAHDFRRAFGERWRHLGPDTLRQLMRHASIETTQRFYIHDNAQKVAEDVWEAWERRQGGGNGFAW